MKTWIIILAALLFISVVVNAILAVRLHIIQKTEKFDESVMAAMASSIN